MINERFKNVYEFLLHIEYFEFLFDSIIQWVKQMYSKTLFFYLALNDTYVWSKFTNVKFKLLLNYGDWLEENLFDMENKLKISFILKTKYILRNNIIYINTISKKYNNKKYKIKKYKINQYAKYITKG